MQEMPNQILEKETKRLIKEKSISFQKESKNNWK